jgi:hypothetical protein
VRRFHVVTAITGLSILTALTLESIDRGWELAELLFWPAIVLQWMGMLVLTAYVGNRAVRTARGDRQYLRRLTISGGVFLFVLFMPFLFRMSIPLYG